jgi:protein dithiol oxidoreductase (disulfide-forming)
MDRGECDPPSDAEIRGSRPVRVARRQLLSMIALGAVGLRWSLPATAQRCASAGIDPRAADEPSPLPYRDLERNSTCAQPPERRIERRIVIEEFFTYNCASCSALDAELAGWQRALPSDAQLVRVPATYSALARRHAEVFYTAKRLGKLDQLHAVLYQAVQRDSGSLDSIEPLATLFSGVGVEPEAFASEFNSPEVYVDVDRAAYLNRRYGVTAAPTLVVGGRYLTTPEIAGSIDAMLAAAAERVAALGRQH